MNCVSKKYRCLFFVAAFFIFYSNAHANAGTPLMWAGFIHLFIGNFFIGIVEGIILALILKIKLSKPVFFMVLGNYFSAWMGSIFINIIFVPSFNIDLHNAWQLFWLMVLLTYFVTLIAEFPFVVISLFKQKKWLKKSIIASLIIQTVSYSLLFGWYWAASGKSLYTQMDIVKASTIPISQNIVVYYIGKENKNIYKINLQTLKKEIVFSGISNKLDTTKSESSDSIGKLVVKTPEETKIIKKIYKDYSCFNKYVQGEAYKLSTAKDSKYDCYSGFWAIEGLTTYHKRTKEKYKLCFETPLAQWNVRYATHLPGDKIILQLGKDQICLYDFKKKKVALLTKGKSPMVTLE